MKRINLGWGGGDFDVLLDIRSGYLYPYSNEETAQVVHNNFGGVNNYSSITGLSGSGWVPVRPWLVKVSTYRTDVRTSYMFDCCVTEIPSGIYVPINYSQGYIPENYPALFVQEESREVCFFRTDQVVEFLCGEVDFAHRHIDSPSIKRVGVEVAVWELHFQISKGCPMQGVRRVLEALHMESLAFEWPENIPPSLNFWSRLGLSQIGSDLYKITSGIARKCYTREELDSVEALQAASPNNVCVLSPTIYVQEGKYDNGFDAVGLFSFDGEELDFEVHLKSNEAYRAMRGDFFEIQRKLEEGVVEKHRKMLEDRAQQALWVKDQAEREGIFLQLCKEHGELEITLQDSLASGNCLPGTEDFRDRTFAGRESVTVKELVRFLSVYGVRRVLEHKLLSSPIAISLIEEVSLKEPAIEEVIEVEELD